MSNINGEQILSPIANASARCSRRPLRIHHTNPGDARVAGSATTF
jgi:hypothetical protein